VVITSAEIRLYFQKIHVSDIWRNTENLWVSKLNGDSINRKHKSSFGDRGSGRHTTAICRVKLKEMI